MQSQSISSASCECETDETDAFKIGAISDGAGEPTFLCTTVFSGQTSFKNHYKNLANLFIRGRSKGA